MTTDRKGNMNAADRAYEAEHRKIIVFDDRYGTSDHKIEPMEVDHCEKWPIPEECENPRAFTIWYRRKRARTADHKHLCAEHAKAWCELHGLPWPPVGKDET